MFDGLEDGQIYHDTPGLGATSAQNLWNFDGMDTSRCTQPATSQSTCSSASLTAYSSSQNSLHHRDAAANALLDLHNQQAPASPDSYLLEYPNNNSASTPVRLNPYGHVDILDIPPLQSDMVDFQHRSAPLSALVPDILPEILKPPPISHPPPTVNHVYPQSPIWYRTSDPGYALGACYTTSISTDTKGEDRIHQLSVAMPKEADVQWNGERYVYPPEVGGCITPPASMPLRLDIHCGRRFSGSATFACYHTRESLASLHPSVWAEVEPLAKALETEVFGRFANPDGLPDILPFYAHENLKQNDRSSKYGQRTNVSSGESKTFDGSYSLTITVEQGHGQGTIKPISQLGTDAFRDQLHRIVSILKQLYQLLVPLSVSAFEWEIIKFQLQDNNVFMMGGLDVSGVAVQMNVSSSALHRVLAGSLTRGLELAHSIGKPQGNLHPDPMDAVTVKTLLTILFRLPKGSAAGSILLARYGIQVPFGISGGEVWMVNVVFDARTIHGARNVSIVEDEDFELCLPDGFDGSNCDSDWQHLKQIWKTASKVNRVAFVQYVPQQAAFRTGNYATTPSVHFGNTGSLGAGDAKVKTFAGDGEHILGPPGEGKSKLAWEAAMTFFNTLGQSGLTLPPEYTASSLVSKMSYTHKAAAGHQEQRKLILPSFDVLDPKDRAYVIRMRQHLSWYYALLRSILIPITQEEFFAHQDQLSLPPPQPLNPDYVSNSHAEIRRTAMLPPTGLRASLRQAQIKAADSPISPPPTIAIARTKPRAAKSAKESKKPANSKKGSSRVKGCLAKTSSKNSSSSRKIGEKRKHWDSEGESEVEAEERVSKRTQTQETESSEVSDVNGKTAKKSKAQELRVGLQGEFFVVGSSICGNYYVDKIVAHEYHDGSYWFRVSYEGWPLDKALWYKEIDLPDARDLVSEYKTQNKLGQTNRYASLDGSILNHVFAVDMLQARFCYVVETRSFFSATRKAFTMDTNFRQFVASYREQATRQHYLTASLSELPVHPPENDEALVDYNASAEHLFERVVGAIKPIPLLIETTFALDIWKQAALWQYCRSIIIVYHFITWGLPDLTDILLRTYSRDTEYLKKHYPRYYPLIHHLWLAVTEYRSRYRSRTRRKKPQPSRLRLADRRATTESSDDEQGSLNDAEDETAPPGRTSHTSEGLTLDIPADLFGLHLSAPPNAPPVAYRFRYKRVDPGNEGVARRVREAFLDLIERHLIAPSLEAVLPPKTLGKRKATQSTDTVQPLLDEMIVRGALLTTVAEALGNESIFASPTVELLIYQPVTSFWGRQTYSRIADQLRNNRDHEVDHIRSWISNNVTSETLDLMTDLGYQTHLVISEFVEGRKLSDKSYEGLNRRLVKDQVNGTRRLTDDRRLLTVEELVGSRETISFGVIGLILREVMLEDSNGHHQALHWYLKGLDPTTGQPGAQFDCDCSYPIRHRNQATQLLWQHISPTQLTTELGLSNLFSWMGTGQGNRTSTFLSYLQTDRAETFWSESLDACIDQFIAAFHHNQSILTGHRGICIPEDQEVPPPNVAGMVQYSNCRIYGQASNLLKLMPTVGNQKDFLNTFPPKSRPEERIRMKFTPYWQSDVQDKWREFLGDLAGTDPASVGLASKRSWWDALEMVQSLAIDGFKDGLTAMQMANNLALAGIVLHPTIDEMASWIWLHQDKGAFRGLQQLGFASMPTRRAVVVALTCFCDHLWGHCPEQLREALGCNKGNVIDAEHLLCKIPRWTSKIKELRALGDEAELTSDALTSTTFPFPLRAQREVVQNVLDSIQRENDNQ
ncbi:hypothetical protein V5O48_002523 [Marasmius crinis-equi]|uniref:Uncharacterized protein n=1 Tax=Marasmius crinis-equi TaxID=585013 RepID=A0ABR3FVG8_9AGAR